MKTNYLVIIDTGTGRMFAKSYTEKGSEKYANIMRSMHPEWTVKVK